MAHTDSTICKTTKWTGRTTVGLGHIQSIIDLRRSRSHAFSDRLSSLYSGDDSKNDCRLIINISGLRFETLQSTLERYPNTLLGNQRRRALFYDKKRDEYFFDRHRLCFEAILYYYQSQGRLRRPQNVPLDTFLEEITYFDLGPVALEQVKDAENLEEARKVQLPKNRICRRIWTTLEYPQYSVVAKIINIISLTFILASAIGLAVETLPIYHPTATANDQCQHEADGLLINTNVTWRNHRCPNIVTSPFYILQAVCIGFFTIEFLLRLITCPSYLKFMKSILTWIDLLAIIPFYIRLIIILIRVHYETDSSVYMVLRMLRIIRFIRIFKLYRIFKSVQTLRILASTLKESIPDFIIILTFLSLSGFLFGAAFYFAENGSNQDMFDSIPKATYYGIMTITAVGYGDVSPITPLGRGLASLCAIFGISVVSMLVSVLAERYQRVFTRKLFLSEEYSDNLVFEDDEVHDPSLRSQTSMEDQSKIQDHSVGNLVFTGIPKDDSEDDLVMMKNTSESSTDNNRIQFIIGFISDDSKKTILTDTVRDLLQMKLGNQCVITAQTDIVS